MNERMEEEVARRTKTLRDSLAASEQEAQNNRTAAQILTNFINSGQAYQDDQGNVLIRDQPNNISNQGSQQDQFSI